MQFLLSPSSGDDTPTAASGIERLRDVLTLGTTSAEGAHLIYTKAANGSLPVVVSVLNEVCDPVISLHKYAVAHII